MKEKTKKWLVTAGLAAVCVGLVFGISRILYREPMQKPITNAQDISDTAEIIIDIGKMRTVITGEKETEMTADWEETEETLVIEIDRDPKITTASDREQEIQPEPKKTEKEKPSGPPAASENGDTGESGGQPSDGEAKKSAEQATDESTKEPVTQPTDEIPRETETRPSDAEKTPRTGDTKDGLVYVEGFGWLPDEGEGSGTYAGDMYENGNKIGIMD